MTVCKFRARGNLCRRPIRCTVYAGRKRGLRRRRQSVHSISHQATNTRIRFINVTRKDEWRPAAVGSGNKRKCTSPYK